MVTVDRMKGTVDERERDCRRVRYPEDYGSRESLSESGIRKTVRSRTGRERRRSLGPGFALYHSPSGD